MKTLTKIILVVVLIIVASIIFLTLFFSGFDTEVFKAENDVDPKCQAQKQMNFLVLKGKVDTVFEDSNNHSINTLIVNTGSGFQTVYLEQDQSGLFYYLQSGDSVIKKYKESQVVVKRDADFKAFKLDYGCNENSDLL